MTFTSEKFKGVSGDGIKRYAGMPVDLFFLFDASSSNDSNIG
jgi:hypothetical protein